MFTIQEFIDRNPSKFPNGADAKNPQVSIPIAKALKAEGYECHLIKGPDGWPRRYWGLPEEFVGRTRKAIKLSDFKIP